MTFPDEMEPKSLYFEIHVTFNPVNGAEPVALFEKICKDCGYRPAKLIMQKTGEVNPYDAFCTSRTRTFKQAVAAVVHLVEAMKAHGFIARRYKIEDTVLDSNILEELNILVNSGKTERV